MIAEGKKEEISIAGVNDKTIGSMIEFIYTGELSGEDFDLQKLIYLADKHTWSVPNILGPGPGPGL